MSRAGTALRRAARLTGYGVGTGALCAGAVGGYVYVSEPGAKRAVRFWRTAGPIVASYSWVRFRVKDEAERDERYRELHQLYASSAREVIEDLRGMFVKVAQVLSVRAEVVPDAYRQEFRKLQDAAPASRWEAVQETLERDLAAPLGETFESIEKEPLGAASIGQAHLARYKGRDVVVKVQYPEAESNFRADFWCLETLMSLVAGPDAVRLCGQVRQQFEIELDYAQEARHLQGLYEAFTNHSAGSAFAGRVAIPKPIPELTAGAVIGMEYLPGAKLESVCLERLEALGLIEKGKSMDEWMRSRARDGVGAAGLGGMGGGSGAGRPPGGSGGGSLTEASGQPSRWQRLGLWLLRGLGVDLSLRLLGFAAEWRLRLQRALGSQSAAAALAASATTAELKETLQLVLDAHGFQLFFCPFFNGDPHPGNILKLHDGRVGLIDFGQCKSLTNEDRTALAHLLLALSEPGAGDSAASKSRIAEAFQASGVRSVNSDESFLAALPRVMFCQITPDMLDRKKMHALFTNDRVEHMPVTMIMAYRAAMLLRGLCLVLQENVSVAQAWRPWAELWLRSQGVAVPAHHAAA